MLESPLPASPLMLGSPGIPTKQKEFEDRFTLFGQASVDPGGVQPRWLDSTRDKEEQIQHDLDW